MNHFKNRFRQYVYGRVLFGQPDSVSTQTVPGYRDFAFINSWLSQTQSNTDTWRGGALFHRTKKTAAVAVSQGHLTLSTHGSTHDSTEFAWPFVAFKIEAQEMTRTTVSKTFGKRSVRHWFIKTRKSTDFFCSNWKTAFAFCLRIGNRTTFGKM